MLQFNKEITSVSKSNYLVAQLVIGVESGHR